MKNLIFAAIVALLVPLAAPAAAKDVQPASGMQPVAVISLASYQSLLSDIGYIGTISNNPGLDQNIEGMLKLFTQGQGVNGLDRKRPWGAVVNTDGLQFEPLIFLPVESLKQLLTSLAAVVGEARDMGNGVYQIAPAGQTAFVREQGGWAYIAQKAESLAKLPTDPNKILGGLDKLYDVAVRLYVNNIPDAYRTFAIDQIKSGIDLEKEEGESDEDFATRKAVVENQINQIVSAVNDTDQVTLGWQIDQTTKSTFLEVNWTALPNSKMARQFAQIGETTSVFTGFMLPKSAIALNFGAKVPPEDAESTKLSLKAVKVKAHKWIAGEDSLKDEAAKNAVREAFDEILDAVGATLAAGKLDAGAALSLDSNTPRLVVGGLMANPTAIDNALKKLSKQAGSIPDFPEIKFDAAQHAGVRFHTMQFPVKGEDEQKILGDKVNVAIGVGAKSAYLAVGRDSLELLNTAIDASATAGPKTILPVRITVSLGSILKFAAAVSPDKPALSIMAGELAKTPEKDHILITAKAAPGGVLYRYTAEEGVLKLIGQASKMAAGGAGVQGQ